MYVKGLLPIVLNLSKVKVKKQSKSTSQLQTNLRKILQNIEHWA